MKQVIAATHIHTQTDDDDVGGKRSWQYRSVDMSIKRPTFLRRKKRKKYKKRPVHTDRSVIGQMCVDRTIRIEEIFFFFDQIH